MECLTCKKKISEHGTKYCSRKCSNLNRKRTLESRRSQSIRAGGNGILEGEKRCFLCKSVNIKNEVRYCKNCLKMVRIQNWENKKRETKERKEREALIKIERLNSEWRDFVVEKIVSNGKYFFAVVRDHPYSDQCGYILHHRVLMENKIKRFLREDEVVHHDDLDPKNNDIDNLVLMTDREHASLHQKLRKGK